MSEQERCLLCGQEFENEPDLFAHTCTMQPGYRAQLEQGIHQRSSKGAQAVEVANGKTWTSPELHRPGNRKPYNDGFKRGGA